MENYIKELRKRLAQHDGCSRFGSRDSILLRPYVEIEQAVERAKAALNGDSNDEEHDALFNLLSVLGEVSEVSPKYTPSGYDPAWLIPINAALKDRDGGVVLDDISNELWAGFIGPMLDAIEEVTGEQ